jgi:hypothetical protein
MDRLLDFICAHREAIIVRCEAKVAQRIASPTATVRDNRGVPLLLDQVIGELRDGVSRVDDITLGAGEHGRNLLLRGYTVSEVVYDYGDVCQAVTDLAVDMNAPIGAADFRTLNRCLDDAIAGAVTEYARGRTAAATGESQAALRVFVETASTALEAIQTGRVGVGGSTGALLRRNLESVREYLTRFKSDLEQAPRVVEPDDQSDTSGRDGD